MMVDELLEIPLQVAHQAVDGLVAAHLKRKVIPCFQFVILDVGSIQLNINIGVG